MTPAQEQGFIGRAVGGMIRRSVKQRFHTVYWRPPNKPLPQPAIFVPNHHGWFDGYLMFLAAMKLEIPIVDWIQEFEAFPLFAKIGGMPFPTTDAAKRTATVRQTIRVMKTGGRSLLLFAEGKLHYPPEVLPFERSLDFMAAQVPDAHIVPVAIAYEHSLHERPEAYIAFGEPLKGDPIGDIARSAVVELLSQTRDQIRNQKDSFEILAAGTKDVNERMDMRRFKK